MIWIQDNEDMLITFSFIRDWNNETFANDLAILQLNEPLHFDKYVQPVCLPGPDPQSSADAIIIGWGAEYIGGEVSKELKQARVKIIDQCERYWDTYDEDNQICIGERISGNSACQGDSGGPLLQQYNDQWIVHGVASFIDDCKTNGDSLPNVYVKVSSYLEWDLPYNSLNKIKKTLFLNIYDINTGYKKFN